MTMWATVSAWVLVVLLWTIAISSAVSGVLFIGGAISHLRMDLEWAVIFGFVGLMMLVFATGAAFAAMMVRGSIP